MTPYYSDDLVTVYHGDCREVLPALDRPDAIVTDPPYGLSSIMQGGEVKWPLWERGKGKTLEWDGEAPAFVSELPALADHCIIWGGNYYPLPPARGWLVWDKIVRSFSSGHCELAWTTLDQPVRAYNFSHGALAVEGKFHPTQKPLDLMRWCLGFLPPDTGSIIDPFMGSGTTLRAAKDAGIRAVGVELDERYCEIAAKRMAQEALDFGGVA